MLLIGAPLVQVGKFDWADQMLRSELVGLSFVLRAVVDMMVSGMPKFVRQNAPLRTLPQPRVDQYHTLVWQPEAMRSPQGANEYVDF